MSMHKYVSYHLCTVGCFLMFYGHVGQVSAQKNPHVIQVKSLEASSELHHCADIGLFLDAVDGSVIVSCSIDGFIGRESKIFIFSHKQDEWRKKEKSYKTSASRIISNGNLSLVTYHKFVKEPQGLFEVYDLTEDFEIAGQPRQLCELQQSDSFENKYGRIVNVVAGSEPNSYLLLGEYFADNLNLFTVLPRIMSAGHAGIVNIPFVTQINDGKVIGYYDLQTKFEDREYPDRQNGIIEGDTAHLTWIKGRNYSSFTPKVMYAQFDLGTHQWSTVEEVFRGNKYGSPNVAHYYDEPAIVVLDGNVHCAWAYASVRANTEETVGKSGVFYRIRTGSSWRALERLSSSAACQCKLVAGKDSVLRLFWIDYQKAVYQIVRTSAGWQEPVTIYQDSNIDVTLPFDIKVDPAGNTHLIYLTEEHYDKPAELMYVNIEKQTDSSS